MFLHNFKYEFLSNIRQKEFLFWMVCFPIILGTFFNLAFGNLYDDSSVFKEIPVAVVEVNKDETFDEVIKGMDDNENKLFSFRYEDAEKADTLLSEGDVVAVITVDNDPQLTFKDTGIKQTIVKGFVDQYISQKDVITKTAASSPEKLPTVIEKLSSDVSTIKSNSLSGGNMNPYDSYFQNLITMAALFGCTTGVNCATRNQGNLSSIGARKCLSPKHGFITLVSSLLSAVLTQFIAAMVSITYVLFILKVNMGRNIPMIYLSGMLGSLTGVSIGFFIGSVGRSTEAVKTAISTAFTMFSCFLSGLMIGDMKATVNEKMPIVNKLNPAALISDLFYCLTIYDDYSRYIEKAVTLLIISAVAMIGGLLLTRRKTYEHL